MQLATPLTTVCVYAGKMSGPTAAARLKGLFPDATKRARILVALCDLSTEKGDRLLLLGDDEALTIALEALLTAPAAGTPVSGFSLSRAA